MHKRLPAFFSLILILSIFFTNNIVRSQSHTANVTSETMLIDSLYESLSISDRMSQFLLIDGRNDQVNPAEIAMEFGGILLNEASALEHLELVKKINESSTLAPLIFSKLTGDLAIMAAGTEKLGSESVFKKVKEPHLFYKTGLTLAEKSKILGISCLIPARENDLLSEDQIDSYWKLSEINQGMMDGGVLPLNAFEIIEFSDFSIDALKYKKKPVQIVIRQDEIPDFHEKLQEAIAMDSISIEELEGSIRNILAIKARLQIRIFDPRIQLAKLKKTSFCPLQFELAKAAIELKNNPRDLIPIKDLADQKIALLDFNAPTPTFRKYLERYAKIDFFKMDYQMSQDQFASTWNDLANFDMIICGFHPSDDNLVNLKDFNVFLGWLDTSSKSIIADFTGPLQDLPVLSLLNNAGLIVSPEDTDLFHKLIPQVIFGGISLDGSQSLSGGIKTDLSRDPMGRFAYTYPESVGLQSDVLSRIDSIATLAIEEKATPGCQILVAKDNQVIYQKSFGFHTYDSVQAVVNDDLYDLASVTKVSGALPGLMKLYEEGKFDLDATLGTYVKYFRRGNKKDLTFREILAHQSGMIPYIAYWQTTIKRNGKYKWRTLSDQQSDKYPYEIAPDIYLHKAYRKKIYRQIRKTKLGEKRYLYSGLTFLIFPEIIENISGQEYEDYLYENFYKPLGATTITYNPLEKFDPERIVPTEYDSLFRKSQIQGKVHDEAAAMMRGISSNAGLFANANDLAKLWQMYCNYGEFGGKRYLKEETVKEFARCQYPENDNRRGLGFDRPVPEPHPDGNTAVSVSQSSFGHTGFTGTFAWADPEYNLVYIFLSNRVYPTRNNTKLYDLNIRTNIQQVIYDAMEK